MHGVNSMNPLEGEPEPALWKTPPLSHKQGYQRPFVAWDGEGITYEPGTAQSYVLFGCSEGYYIKGRDLSTKQCLDALLFARQLFPETLFVGFALGYDFNMILKDLDAQHLWRIYNLGACKWNGYYIKRVPGKWLTVRKPGQGRGVRLYDVFGFFQSSFVSACEKYLGADDPELDRIRMGKAARSQFRYDQLDTEIVPYWQGELRLLVRLMDSLRDDFTGADIRVNSWHGPGAVANAVFNKFNIKQHKQTTPEEVNRAAQYAYAGGRFELFRCGHYPHPVWEYDINSAYPEAIAKLPSLQGSSWEETDTFDPESFGVWRVEHQSTDHPPNVFFRPHPLYYRGPHGEVSFPADVSGWYWTPEASLVPDAIKHGWVLRHNGELPFDFIREMYETRRKWKNDGNSAERALKLALNSLYGKMAQRVGATQGPPQWHQLEWAGYVTSHCRAKLWNAISLIPEAVIAVETDAIFTTQKLALPIGPELGQWERTDFDWITYIQSGLYYGSIGGHTLERYRGFDKGSLPHTRIMDYLHEYDGAFEPWKVPSPSGACTRFVTMGLGLRTRAIWRAWETTHRQVVLGGGGKRAHRDTLCKECQERTPISEHLHSMVVTQPGGESYPHRLPWKEEEEYIDNPLRFMADIEADR